MEIPEILDLIYNNLCFLCLKRNSNMLNVTEVLEIRDRCFNKEINLIDIMNYLFPSHDLISSQVCRECTNLLIKTYISLFKNKLIKTSIRSLINHIHEIIIKPDRPLIINLTFNSNAELSNNIQHKFLNKPTNDAACNKLSSAIQLEYGGEILQEHCPQCHKTFTNSKSLKSHISNHNNKRRKKYYNCYNCDYRTLCKTTLSGHINKHHLKIRPFTCDTCFKGFYSKSNLTEHLQCHNNAGEVCEVCGELFGHRKTLLEHLRLHRNHRPYRCEYCGKNFVTSGRRSDHIKRSHMEKNEICVLCAKKFGLKKELTRHMKTVHA